MDLSFQRLLKPPSPDEDYLPRTVYQYRRYDWSTPRVSDMRRYGTYGNDVSEQIRDEARLPGKMELRYYFDGRTTAGKINPRWGMFGHSQTTTPWEPLFLPGRPGRPGRSVQVPRLTRRPSSSKFWTVKLDDWGDYIPCVQRRRRRAVLFAKKRAGSNPGPRKWKRSSYWDC